MLKLSRSFLVPLIFAVFIIIISLFSGPRTKNIPLVAIANYGPHASLEETINGIKHKLMELGYEENTNIRFEVSNVNFDTSLIMQMLSKLQASNPDLIVTLSTPVAQSAKNIIKDIPIVFTDVTDPKEAGLIVENDTETNITGASDKQDVSLVLDFAKALLPNATRLGVLYSTGEANDLAMVKMLQLAASSRGIFVLAVPLEHTRDAVSRMQLFKNNVDFIYTGSSGAIQAALPAIVTTAEEMTLPVINFDSSDVKNHAVLASFGISHAQVGANAAIIIDKILKGEKPANIPVIFPEATDHLAYISKKRAEKIGFQIPDNLPDVKIVE